MHTAPPPSEGFVGFEGYDELVRKPLEPGDPRSFSMIQKLLRGAGGSPSCPFSLLVKALSSIDVPEGKARFHWKRILEHKRRMESRISRVVNVRTAAVDYYDQLGVYPGAGASGLTAHQDGRQIEISGAPMERLREETLRARRYKHALSAIMFNVDIYAADGTLVSLPVREKVTGVVATMIRGSVRAVDVLARHTENLLLLILPNTNAREAMELAARLKNNLFSGPRLIRELGVGVVITLAFAQCARDDGATEFANRLKHLLVWGKQEEPEAVHPHEEDCRCPSW
jgi:GGDEF domain-containing protein